MYFALHHHSYLYLCSISVNMVTMALSCLPYAGIMLGQRRRRWSNIKPALGQGVVFAWLIGVFGEEGGGGCWYWCMRSTGSQGQSLTYNQRANLGRRLFYIPYSEWNKLFTSRTVLFKHVVKFDIFSAPPSRVKINNMSPTETPVLSPPPWDWTVPP